MKNKIKKSIKFWKSYYNDSLFSKGAKEQVKRLEKIYKQKIKKGDK